MAYADFAMTAAEGNCTYMRAFSINDISGAD